MKGIVIKYKDEANVFRVRNTEAITAEHMKISQRITYRIEHNILLIHHDNRIGQIRSRAPGTCIREFLGYFCIITLFLTL